MKYEIPLIAGSAGIFIFRRERLNMAAGPSSQYIDSGVRTAHKLSECLPAK